MQHIAKVDLALYATFSTHCNSLYSMQLISKATLALSATYSTYGNSLHSMQLISKATHALSATHSKAIHWIQWNSFQKQLLHSVQLISQSMQLITFNSFDSIKLIPIPRATLALITTHCIQCNSLHWRQLISITSTHSQSMQLIIAFNATHCIASMQLISNLCTHYI